MSRDPLDVSFAVHEAGHAVVATLTGLAVRYATLAARGGGALVVLRGRRSGFPPKESIAVSCAGMIAQDIAGTDERWDIAQDSHAGDVTDIRADARAWHAKIGDATVQAIIEQSWALAFDVVVDNYGAVLAVAERLLDSRKALTGPEIRACVNAAPTARPDQVPADGRTFWLPDHSSLRNWGPAARRPRKTPARRAA